MLIVSAFKEIISETTAMDLLKFCKHMQTIYIFKNFQVICICTLYNYLYLY